ncbi:hydroxymethylglutaryl-CoA lyase [Agrobacterium rosae]|uniref:Hydroxymethylglutaryl-CoA lyase n=1 Tax=Agrobacterium rosae TaxID=1972867 RepID=A0AAE5RYP5_9HYPH|nr:hydroxymethylglutaryl-CoA lyase [Agrobacterium rosae]KAA3511416.1 hydroxymethylglutaryl-CoA lyase [Agrobacterium rosae]KAA3519160.1 hydroxymethylglutaryl-CoA lyase [Agrobacterium rosae]MBN7806981.1 hydroxymethylglutaryl-CoA lyase [Agrobacterium rosae]MCM2436198.1 hydroxymethylglutaryl-CoA lyase [Agrobacterium rosae]MDX8332269.1 hydroxymethylglutaryl-CoA lyase [Agrobacterium rosae]
MTDVYLQEVCPRDGLQIESVILPTDDKVRLIDSLSQTGFSRIEVSSFVSPKAVPALADAAEVFARITRVPSVTYVALVPNRKGAERAIEAEADELNMVASVSRTHNLANMRMTTEESFLGFSQIARLTLDAKRLLNGTIATAFGCPFEGAQSEVEVLELVGRYRELGCTGITLADTTGMANPRQVTRLVGAALSLVGPEALTLHFHNTRGLGLANVVAAFQAGARRFDAALGGLGGCPFAPGASGNIATEDTAAMFEEMGVPTGLDLRTLLSLSHGLPTLVGHDVPGQVVKAGLVGDLHPAPI